MSFGETTPINMLVYIKVKNLRHIKTHEQEKKTSRHENKTG